MGFSTEVKINLCFCVQQEQLICRVVDTEQARVPVSVAIPQISTTWKSKLLILKAAAELGRRTRAQKVTHKSQQKCVTESLC
jgi:hypothetical protein